MDARLYKQWAARYKPEITIEKVLPITRDDYFMRTTEQSQGDYEEYLDSRNQRLKYITPTVHYRIDINKVPICGRLEAQAIRIIIWGTEESGKCATYLRSNGYEIDITEVEEYAKEQIKGRKIMQEEEGSGDWG